MKRKIIEINEALCNGCELCVTACHEGAIKIVNGKAKLISDEYCDGLGDCLPTCPTDAIKMIEREADDYNEALVMAKIKERQVMSQNRNQETSLSEEKMPCGCPGTMAKSIERNPSTPFNKASMITTISEEDTEKTGPIQAQLNQWPVQMKLINSTASFLEDADILIAADCTAYAYGNFHNEFLKDKVTIIACPKLDDNNYNKEKIKEILVKNNINSITVVRMEVPCCSGIISATKEAMLEARKIVQYKEVIISTDGKIL